METLLKKSDVMKVIEDMINNLLHFMFGHKWQERGQNGYGTITYRVCLRCGKAQRLVSNVGEAYSMTYTETQYQKDKDTLIRIRPLIESIGIIK